MVKQNGDRTLTQKIKIDQASLTNASQSLNWQRTCSLN